MDTNSDRVPVQIATFDPDGHWGEFLAQVAHLRGHAFADIISVTWQHTQHITTGRRHADEPFPRVLGTAAQWHDAGWQVPNDALGYDAAERPGQAQARLYSLAEVTPTGHHEDGTEDAWEGGKAFDPAEPAGQIGTQKLAQRVWDDLAAQLERLKYDLSYTYDADRPRALIDHRDRAVWIPGWTPQNQRVAELAYAVTSATLQPTAERARPALQDTIDVITSSATHIVLTATGLDPAPVPFPSRHIPLSLEPDQITQLVHAVGKFAYDVAHKILSGISTPLRHNGLPAPSEQRGLRPPSMEASEQAPPDTSRPAPAPEIDL